VNIERKADRPRVTGRWTTETGKDGGIQEYSHKKGATKKSQRIQKDQNKREGGATGRKKMGKERKKDKTRLGLNPNHL